MEQQIPVQQPNIPAPLLPAPRKSPALKIIALVFLVGLISFGVVLGTGLWSPLWSPFRLSPEKVLTRMQEKMKEAKYFHALFDMSAEVDSIFMPGKITITYEADFNLSDPQTPKTNGNAQVYFLSQGEAMLAKAGILVADKDNMYLRVDQLNSTLAEMAIAQQGIDKDSFIGKYIKMPSNFTETYQPSVQQIELTDLFVFKQQLPDTEVSGHKTYHYILGLDINKLVDLMTAQTGQEDTDFGPKMFAAALSSMGEWTAELFIGKDDYMLYETKVQKSLDFGKLGLGLTGLVSFDVDITYSNYGKVVEIKAPQDSIDMTEIIQSGTIDQKL
ncbi:hypothetical protein KKG36_02150 [Patescibacteria group bacterium]|nr:hypothetical protein [Patescibacteria group bacterium]